VRVYTPFIPIYKAKMDERKVYVFSQKFGTNIGLVPVACSAMHNYITIRNYRCTKLTNADVLHVG